MHIMLLYENHIHTLLLQNIQQAQLDPKSIQTPNIQGRTNYRGRHRDNLRTPPTRRDTQAALHPGPQGDHSEHRQSPYPAPRTSPLPDPQSPHQPEQGPKTPDSYSWTTRPPGPGHRDEPPTQRCHHQEAQLPSLEAPQKKPPQCPRPQPPSQHRPPPTTDEAMYPEPNDGASHEAVDRQYNDPQQGVLQKNPTRAGPKPKQHGHTQQQPPQHGATAYHHARRPEQKEQVQKAGEHTPAHRGIHHGRRGNRS
ncbi:acidic proline-rich protein PRP25-like [Procambarus clarkii]|uniref:acidic proline-rich protein PRP25-like n=1 Tax=Procambarus clarkii TaxID=6728 RepID=UPI00374270E9